MLTIDCDFQHLLPEFRDLFDGAAEGNDVVIGSRFSRHSVLLNYPFAKIFANRAFHALAVVLFGRRIRDVTNNLKIMRREVVLDLQLREPGFAVNAETGLQPMLLGYRVKQVPISWINRTPGMGTSSFRLLRVGGGYWKVLAGIVAQVCLWRGTVPGPLPAALRERANSEGCRASTHGGTQTISARQQMWLLLAVFAVAALVRLGLTGRHSLWADEVFSLAIATGHSLEHPAATADPALGDFVEPEGPVYAEEFKRYLAHEDPPASPARVVRAVFLSDTNPPLYYLLLYGWTLVTGTSDVALRLFSTAWSLACLPLLAGVARRTGGSRAVLPSCILFALSPLAVYYSAEGRMYSLLWFWVLATAWVSLVWRQRGGNIALCAAWVGASAAGFLTHYFFLFPWVAIVIFLVARPGKLARIRLDDMHFRDGAGDRALVLTGAGVSRSLAGHSGLVEDRAVALRPLGSHAQSVLPVFLWGSRNDKALGTST